jgi:MFS family permease
MFSSGFLEPFWEPWLGAPPFLMAPEGVGGVLALLVLCMAVGASFGSALVCRVSERGSHSALPPAAFSAQCPPDGEARCALQVGDLPTLSGAIVLICGAFLILGPSPLLRPLVASSTSLMLVAVSVYGLASGISIPSMMQLLLRILETRTHRNSSNPPQQLETHATARTQSAARRR